MALNVIVMGPPGAGKGTQAERLARARGLLKISTGDILREAVQSQSALGLKAKATIESGKLVDDDTMIGIVRERLLQPDARRGFVLDGFPRTVAQARALDEIVRERNDGPLVVIDIEVPEAELVRRLGARRICRACGATVDPLGGGAADRCRRCGGELVQRTDDGEGIVRRRLAVYGRDTRPLVEYYRARRTFYAVNGARTPDEVARDLDRSIDAAAGQEQRL